LLAVQYVFVVKRTPLRFLLHIFHFSQCTSTVGCAEKRWGRRDIFHNAAMDWLSQKYYCIDWFTIINYSQCLCWLDAWVPDVGFEFMLE
jgi:hypothetical protein